MFKKVDEKEYHAGPELSSHRLIDAARMTGIDYKLKYKGSQERQLIFDRGSIYHMAVLEPERFASAQDYAILPDRKRPTSAQLNAKKPSPASVELMEFWEEWDVLNHGKHHISQANYDNVIGMVEALRDNGKASALLFESRGANEISGYFSIGDNKCRIRIDRLVGNSIIDLKGTTSAAFDDFKKNGFGWKKGYGYGYQTQAAFYQDGAKRINGEDYSFEWIVQEWTYPYKVAFFSMDSELYLEGKEEYLKGIKNHNRYQETGVYPGYPEKTQVIKR